MQLQQSFARRSSLDYLKASHPLWYFAHDFQGMKNISDANLTRKGSVALMNGAVFASYRFFMKLQLKTPESVPNLGQIALAGAGSGIASSYAMPAPRSRLISFIK
jgi:solute carrier family 25 carnitine/acylcarnitine transporter 20/29